MSYEDDVLDCMNDIKKCHDRMQNLYKLSPDFLHTMGLLETCLYLLDTGMEMVATVNRESNSNVEFKPDNID